MPKLIDDIIHKVRTAPPPSRQEAWLVAYVLCVIAGACAAWDFHVVGLVILLISLTAFAVALRAEGLLKRFPRKGKG